MAKYYRYIVCLVFPNQAIHRRGQKTHHTHSHHKSASDNNRRSDKPPGRINNPNRNAKFTSYFLRGEFGVFCHAYKSIAQAVRKYGRTLRVGCRDPPSSDFSLTRKITLTGGKYGEKIRTEKCFYFRKRRIHRIIQRGIRAP